MTAATISPSQDTVYQAIEAFLTGILPTGMPVIRGLPNRAAMPSPSPGFVVVQTILVNRLRWNIDTWNTTNPAPTALYAEHGTEVRVQIDCYGASSSDYATMIGTLWRDSYGCVALAPNCQPLYADEARMVPLIDSEQQYEERWMIDARLQWNPITTYPQTFTGTPASVDLVNVNATYPP